MPKTNHSFTGGLNKDTAKHLYSEEYYFDAKNIALTSEEHSYGSVINHKGTINELSKTGYKLIGSVSYYNYAILFYAEENATTNDYNTTSIIEEVTFDASGNLSTIKLWEGSGLNFRVDKPIKGIITKVDDYNEKIYWTDGNEPLKHANLAEDFSGENSNYFGMLQPVFFGYNSITFDSYISGSLYTGMIQYAYRLIKKYGPETTFSTASELIPLSEDSEKNTISGLKGQNQYKEDIKYRSHKGVKLTISLNNDDLDNFDYIEVVSLWYSNNVAEPTINIIDRRELRSLNNIVIYDEGGEANYGSLTLDEYRMLSNEFSARDIEVKDDRLFAANIGEEHFDLDEWILENDSNNDGLNYDNKWDARAYRFNTLTTSDGTDTTSDGTDHTWCRISTAITGADGTTWYPSSSNDYGLNYEIILDGQDSNWKDKAKNIHVEHNALNRSNIPLIDGTPSEIQYPNDRLYQSDGTSLGGKGINISYRIRTKEHPNHYFNDIFESSNLEPDNEEDLKWLKGIKRGFQPLEVYRFGIVFFDEKGRSSFVKWIGDIKFPTHPQDDKAYQSTNMCLRDSSYNKDREGSDGDDLFGGSLISYYPEFTVMNKPRDSENSKYLDWQIVYVKRNLEDRTVLFTSPTAQVDEEDTSEPSYFLINYRDWDGTEYKSKDSSTSLNLNSKDQHYNIFYAPEIQYYPNWYLKSIDFFTESFQLSPDNIVRYDKDNNEWQYFYAVDNVNHYDSDYEMWDFNLGDNDVEAAVSMLNDTSIDRATWEKFWAKVDDKEIVEQQIDPSAILSVMDKSYKNESNVSDSLAAGCHSKVLITKSNTLHGANSTVSDAYLHYPSFSARRNIIQYNGWDYSSRQTNKYIPISDVTSYNTVNCEYGDTYTRVYDMLISSYTEVDDDYIFMIYRIPYYTTINTYLTNGSEFYRKVNKNDTAYFEDSYRFIREDGYVSDDGVTTIDPYYSYNNAFSKVNDSKVYFPKPELYNKQNTYPTQVKYSDKKIYTELSDPFLNFRPNNYNSAENKYGEIARIKEFNNEIYFFQNLAFGVIAINPKVQKTDTSGATVVLGKGSILDDFQYVSTNIGISNKSDIIKSSQGLYWMDINNKEIYRLGQQLDQLGQSGKMSSFFSSVLDDDSSFTGIYDPYYKTVYITVKNDDSSNYLGYNSTDYDNTKFVISEVYNDYYYIQGEAYNEIIPIVGNRLHDGHLDFFRSTDNSIRIDGTTSDGTGDIIDLSHQLTKRNKFTIGFNEVFQTFISFYDFIPNLYFNFGRNIYSSIFNSTNEIYKHNVGDYGYYYGSYYPIIIDVIVALGAKGMAEFYGINYFGNIELDNQSQYNTFGSVRAINDYEVSDEINLYPEDGTRTIIDTSGYHIDNTSNFNNLYNVKRNVRNWHIIFPRYSYHNLLNNSDRQNAGLVDAQGRDLSNRYRDHYVRVRLTHPNESNKKFELNNLQITYRPLGHL